MRISVAGAALVAMLACSGAMAADALKYSGTFALNFASQAGSDNEPFDKPMFAIGLGGTVEIPLAPDLVLETGLLWMRKGGQGSDSGVDYSMALDYVEVPALAKYTLAEGQAYVCGGLTLDFLIRAELVLEVANVRICDYVTNDTSAMDICFAIGGGGSFPVGPGTLNVGILYSRGLVTIDDAGDYDIFNQTVSIMGNYTF